MGEAGRAVPGPPRRRAANTCKLRAATQRFSGSAARGAPIFRNSSGAHIVATYIVFTRESTQDQRELDIYGSKVGATLAGHPVKVLAAYGQQEILEGEGPEGVVIVEFPSKEAAHAWYHGPEYQTVVQHRFKGARYRAVLVEGV
jgi:uncharacterized protein (DUF1330 family)